jgi:hypothetical protein
MKIKTKHYADVNRRVFTYLWSELPPSLKAVIAADQEQTSRAFHNFIEKVESETNRVYHDPDYWYNRYCFPDRWERMAETW